jgi:hypothetical protein
LRPGKGLHSSGGVAKLKPAIEALMQKYAPPFHNVPAARVYTPDFSPRRHNLVAELDPDNSGVLIVQLGGRRSGGRVIGPDEVTRRLEKSDGCLIM